MLGQIILQIFLIALNAVFACAEIATISINDAKLMQMAEKGNKKAARLLKLTENPAKFLATIQVAITLSGFLGSAFAADNFSEKLVVALVGAGVPIPEKTLDTISVILITLILAYFTLVFGELVPKRVAMKKAERIALGLASPITGVAKVFAPLVWLLTASTNGVLRLMGIDPNEHDESVSEEEIRMMVDVGSQKGVIDASEKQMIQNVFEFDDTELSEFATHRKELEILCLEDSDEEWESSIRESRHSLLPVCADNADDIKGILSVKDYYRLSDKSRSNVMEKAVTPAFYFLETAKADAVFKSMKKNGIRFAVVLDEYGGTTGVITINDLIEQLVGDFDTDMSDASRQTIEKVSDNQWRISGGISVEEVSAETGVELDSLDYDTFGGLVMGTYGSIPDDGTVFDIDIARLHIKVLSIRGHCLEKALVTLVKTEEKKSAV